MSNWLVEVMNETRKKEALRNNPNMKPHEYSNFCSCGSCHSISLYADSIRAELVKRLPKEKEEYTDDCNKTCGCYSHTHDKKRWWEIPENIGYNQCIKDLKERIGDETT